ncbi:hypothetical protein [Evansella cellulosilytica]|uniref:Uncharacterized protein n=1 Tax=Evansella cellulosilytica (strain ATCC 21833 / DSM 2522 / FERM P-1141 / JCM 9156 / N-4) TaxID=649639 RepID=E6TSK9_EVAC2|nr:hypothetical protein [Evansella cellulosilytica]ADU29517.1 hypothetical protein Bcell_1252 [Evansella cellulosilytica DSM 2522]
MKKLFMVTFIIIVATTLVACLSQEENEANAEPSVTAEETETPAIEEEEAVEDDEAIEEEDSNDNVAATENEDDTDESALIEKYKEEARRMLTTLNTVFVTNTEEEFLNLYKDIFYDYETYHNNGYDILYTPNTYKDMEINFSEETILLGELEDTESFTYMGTTETSVIEISSGDRLSVKENIVIYVENVDGAYKIISIEAEVID